MVRRVRVYHLTARCECGAPVRLRNTDAGLELMKYALSHPETFGPDTVLQTYQCARQLPDRTLCNKVVEVKVRHWREVP